MRKIKVFEHISLDALIAPTGPNIDPDYANGGWTAPYRSPAGAEAIAKAQGERFDLLLGRTTYDLWAGYWPKIKGGPFADAFNAATKYVATLRPDTLEWGPARALGPDIAADVRAIKSEDGPDLVLWGSSTLTTVLFAEGLVDELVLTIYPVMLGSGKRCFPDEAGPHRYALVSAASTGTGVVTSTYRLF